MKLHRLIPCLALALLAAACSTAEPTMGPRGTPDRFQQALADAYTKFADLESSEYDPVARNILMEKANMAANGQFVPVGDPMEWDRRRGHPGMFGHWVVGFDNKRTLATALDYRARIIPWIEANKARDPVGTAAMQVNFECWLEEMSEDDFEEVQQCGLNLDLLTTVQTVQQTTQVAPAPVPAPAPKTYLVFFDFDRSEITPEAAAIIRQAADDAKRGSVRLIVATGHADRSGPTDYNQRLSERRAVAVKGALIREGIAPNTIQTAGRGENDNLVATADGVREPRNRRVEISFR